jgi:ketosteroid isomerase-like protein
MGYAVVDRAGVDGVGAPGRAEDEAAIRRIEIEWGDAYVKRDLAALDRIMADDYVFTDPLGETSGKAENLAAVAASDVVFESTESDGVRVRFHGATAVVTARSTFRGRYKGWPVAGQFQYTDVFARAADGRWLAVASQVTLTGRGLLRLRLGRFVCDRLLRWRVGRDLWRRSAAA